MKVILTLISVAMLFLTAYSEVPTTISYQGRLTDSSGDPIDTTITMVFSICNDSAATICVWGESQPGVEVVNGLFTVNMGSVSPIPATVFNNENRWLHVVVGSPGGEPIEPPVKLVTVPYSYHAANADTALGLAFDIVTSQHIQNSTIQFSDIGSNGAVDGDVMKYNGSQWMADDCMPVGVIVMWSGSLASIPNGWVLCNGTSGTPDLTDRFIYGVGSGEDPGASGGTNTHSHSIDPPGINTNPNTQTVDVTPGVGQSVAQDNHNHFMDIPGFNSGDGSSLPPYYKLAFIMKQ